MPSLSFFHRFESAFDRSGHKFANFLVLIASHSYLYSSMPSIHQHYNMIVDFSSHSFVQRSSSSQTTVSDANIASRADQRMTLSWNHYNTVKRNHERGNNNYIISNLERLLIPPLNDAKRDGPPRCISLESSSTHQTAQDDDDSIMLTDDACTPLDYRLDWSKDMELSVSECLSSNPSLLGLSPDDIAKTRETTSDDPNGHTAFDQPIKSQRAAWDTLNLSNWHID